MSNQIFDEYVAQFRVLIDSYGAQNAIHCLEKAFELEGKDSQQDRQKQYLKSVAEATSRLYYEVEKL